MEHKALNIPEVSSSVFASAAERDTASSKRKKTQKMNTAVIPK
jgi:hypothetical protein